MKKHYEVLWFEGDEICTKEYRLLSSAMKFYNQHKNDLDKKDWWVTKRNDDWFVIEQYVPFGTRH